MGNSPRTDRPRVMSGSRLSDITFAAGSGEAATDALPTEVGLTELVVLEELGGLPLEDDPPRRQDIAAIGDGERHVRVLLDDEHRHTGFVDLLDDLEAPLDEDR